MAKVIEGLYYSESHEFVRVDGNVGFVGITDYAQNALGTVVYVDMPDVDDEVEAGEEFGAVESTKAASDLISPVSGTVIEVNEALEESHPLAEQSLRSTRLLKMSPSSSIRMLSRTGLSRSNSATSPTLITSWMPSPMRLSAPNNV